MVESLPCRVYVTGPTKPFTTAVAAVSTEDGRFFVDGSFRMVVPPGHYQIKILAGPNYLPLEFDVLAKAGERVNGEATLQQWFSPEAHGWFAGDHHVHAQHDRQAEIKTSLEYAALQARANGLSFVTEAGSNVDYEDLARLSTDQFQIRRAGEIRPGPFVGHLNTPGISAASCSVSTGTDRSATPAAQGVRRLVEAADGIVIHTHPLTPRHQIHWMGAAEYYSDIVCGRPAHALDIDSRSAELLLFAGLNLGNRIAASSYTDCALGRRSTLSPGDRRVYVWLDPQHRRPVDYDAMVKSFRSGQSIATNGGPLFASWEINGERIGSEITTRPVIVSGHRTTECASSISSHSR